MLTPRIRLFVVLATVFVTCLVVGDIIGGKLIETTIFGKQFLLTVGMIPFPVTFLLTDVLNEFYGKRAARFVTVVGFCMALLTLVFIWIAGEIPIAGLAKQTGWDGVTEAGFANVFLGSKRILLSSMVAYLVSQLTDIVVFHRLKRISNNRLLWLRATGSTLVSQLIDTAVITNLAWFEKLSGADKLNMIISSYSLKIMIAVALTPAVYLIHVLVERGLGIAPVVLDDSGDPRPATPDSMQAPQL